MCDGLTRRERQVLEALADGCTIAEAAYQLGLSSGTAHNLAFSARKRLEAKSASHALALVIRAELAARSGPAVHHVHTPQPSTEPCIRWTR